MDAGFGIGHNDSTVSSTSQNFDYYESINAEPSFSSYPQTFSNYPGNDTTLTSPTRGSYVERMKRELSEPQQFDFSSDPSPAEGHSRAETPPSSISRYDDDEDDLRSHGRKFILGVEEADDGSGFKPPGVVTPPNTYVDSYLDEAVMPKATVAGRRASQQSELEPELLYLKLKGTQFSIKGDQASASPSSSAFCLQEGSVPGTPPNSFIGTPVASMLDMAEAGSSSKPWQAYQHAASGNRLEPENLRRRVTELTKNLPPEDVESQENTNG